MRVAGAICTTVVTSGSAIAARRRAISSRSESAPTGQWVMHWPHATQPASRIVRLSATPMLEREPVPMNSHTPMPCSFLQAATQRPH